MANSVDYDHAHSGSTLFDKACLSQYLGTLYTEESSRNVSDCLAEPSKN